ncbi:uncharacterized protein LOC123429504 isoform X1 [Hordeum vulgare subsp. vulgare]|nr:uncharacterized protein LOC123429504 isoform X1 [Hordeum vulgare subsp. vulgare]
MAAGSHLLPTTRTDGVTAPLSSSAPGCLAQATSTKKTMRSPRQQQGGRERETERAMSNSTGEEPGAVAVGALAAECYFCAGAPAVVYCRADAAGLCLPCDRHVHGANTVSCRHARAPLCAVCRVAAATVRRGAARFLCSNCDFEVEQLTEPPVLLHDCGTVEGYTGCPSVGELAAILGVAVRDGDKVWWPVWEEPQVLAFDDVIVPTTACHGLQPVLTSSSSPKNWSAPCGELDGEVLRQLGELAKSEEAAAYVEDAEPAGGDQLPPPWGSSDYAATGHADLGALGAEPICAAAILQVREADPVRVAQGPRRRQGEDQRPLRQVELVVDFKDRRHFVSVVYRTLYVAWTCEGAATEPPWHTYSPPPRDVSVSPCHCASYIVVNISLLLLLLTDRACVCYWDRCLCHRSSDGEFGMFECVRVRASPTPRPTRGALKICLQRVDRLFWRDGER